MKYPKVVETLDRIIYFIWKQEISYRWTQKITGNSDFLWNPTNFLAIVWQVKHGYLLLYESINSPLQKDVFYKSSTIQNELIGILVKYIIQKWLIEEIKEVNDRSAVANEVTTVYVHVCRCV